MNKNYIHKIKSGVEPKTTVIILAAGRNETRGEHCCKSLINVSKHQKAIDHQIKNINEIFNSPDIIVVTGFDKESLNSYIFKKYPQVRIIENDKYQETTSVESLRLGLNGSVLSNVCMINGNIKFNKQAISFTPKQDASYLVVNPSTNKHKKLGVLHQDNKVIRISYGISDQWGEIMYVPQKFFINLKFSIQKYKFYHSLFHVINDLIENDNINFEAYIDPKIKISQVNKK